MDEDPLSATKEDPLSFVLESDDGLSLFGRAWPPAAVPIASMILVHSLGEHSGRYERVAHYFCQRDYAVYAIDLRGHGQSDGQRGHIEQFRDYLNDVKTLIRHVRKQTATNPLFLIGHSLGGLIALTCALKYHEDISSVVISSPALRNRVPVSGWRMFFVNLMSALSPTLTMHNNLDPETLSRSEAVVKAYRADPLVHDQITARWFTEFIKVADWAMKKANTLAVPALILQGGSDQILDPKGAREFFDRIGLEDKYYIEYESLYHEIFNEPEALSVLGDVEAWLIPRLQPQIGTLPLADR